MKNHLVSGHPSFTRLTSRFVALVLFAALFLAAPFHGALAQTAPDLGDASTFSALGGPAVTLTGSAVAGDVGVDTGGAVTLTNSTVDGMIYDGVLNPFAVDAYDDFLAAYLALANANDYSCTGALDTAYTDATLTLQPGVYCNTAPVTFTRTTLTLDAGNDPSAVWIFKIGTLGTGALTGTSLSVVMANGGEACNVYWWVAQAATLTTSKLKGNLLAGAGATFTGGTLFGRALAQAGVTMTGTDVFDCSDDETTVEPDPCKDYSDYWNDYWKEYWKDNCENYCKDCCKHHCKDCWKTCDNCSGKVTELTLQYKGLSQALIRVEMKGKDGGIIFNDYVGPNGEFTINGQDKKGTLGTEITLYVDDVQNTKIHTSCSKPIGPGLVSGDFEVIEGYSKDGGLLATTGNDCWECKGKHHDKDSDKNHDKKKDKVKNK